MSQPNTRRPAYGAYSLTLGEFNSTLPGPEIVAGIPRGQNKDCLLYTSDAADE